MMQLINTLFVTARVHDWLSNTRSARVLHIFDHACNLINEQGQVLSIVTPAIGKGPFNLVIEDHSPLTSLIRLESAISATPTELRIDSFVVQTQRAELWDACPDWRTLHSKRQTILQKLQGIPKMPSPAPNLQFSNSLPSSIILADIPSCIKAAHKLAGLGQGLTPSGDDYIMGALYAAWMIHPRQVAEKMGRDIADTVAPLTTSLSAAWLRAAGNGEAGIVWHTFFDALVSGEQSAIEDGISHILCVGATSGADALAGFINTIYAYMETENKHVIS